MGRAAEALKALPGGDAVPASRASVQGAPGAVREKSASRAVSGALAALALPLRSCAGMGGLSLASWAAPDGAAWAMLLAMGDAASCTAVTAVGLEGAEAAARRGPCVLAAACGGPCCSAGSSGSVAGVGIRAVALALAPMPSGAAAAVTAAAAAASACLGAAAAARKRCKSGLEKVAPSTASAAGAAVWGGWLVSTPLRLTKTL